MIKDSSYEKMGEFGNNLIIFNGGNTVVVFALELGVHGCVWGIANPVPKACVELGRRGLCTGTARPFVGRVGGAVVRRASDARVGRCAWRSVD